MEINKQQFILAHLLRGCSLIIKTWSVSIQEITCIAERASIGADIEFRKRGLTVY